MTLQLRFLGTGDARRVPVYGCHCRACERARQRPILRRKACSALLETDGFRLLIDAGREDLCERFAPGEIDAIVLTHYHMDHVLGLFHLRWGANLSIPVYGPDDPQGCDDLFRRPGILDFRPPLAPFETQRLGPVEVTPLPLNHSRPAQGYVFHAAGRSLAYLTDTLGLPEDSLTWLQRHKPDVMVLDCSMPPTPEPRNHNDLNRAAELAEQVGCRQTYLTHIGHCLDDYWLDHPRLPENLYVAWDEARVLLED